MIRKMVKSNLKTKITTCLFALLFVSSCQTKEDVVYKKIIGGWIIYEFSFKNNNYKENLNLNYISFGKENNISIPEIFEYPAEDEEDGAKWNVQLDNSERIMLNIHSENPMFNNSYKVKFFKNYEMKALGIELRSNSTYIKAYKDMQNFDYDGRDWER